MAAAAGQQQHPAPRRSPAVAYVRTIAELALFDWATAGSSAGGNRNYLTLEEVQEWVATGAEASSTGLLTFDGRQYRFISQPMPGEGRAVMLAVREDSLTEEGLLLQRITTAADPALSGTERLRQLQEVLRLLRGKLVAEGLDGAERAVRWQASHALRLLQQGSRCVGRPRACPASLAARPGRLVGAKHHAAAEKATHLEQRC